MSKPINYPNNIEHHPTVIKLRELIDHANNIKTTVDQNLASVQKVASDQAATIATLPTTNSVNNLINASTGTNGVVTQAIITAITAFAKQNNLTPPTATAADLRVPRALPRARMSGVRESAPKDLGPADAGLLYYITDYAHLAVWDGWAWQLADGGGGYLVESAIELGIGWVLCDGSTTDYVVNDSPTLDVRPFTTQRHRFRRSHQYFRR